jgi:hypothetical protein
MVTTSNKKRTWVIAGFVGILILGTFVASRIVPLLRGSEITLSQLPEKTEITDSKITLSGTAFDTKQLSVNGTIVPLSPTGTFTQTILLHPGYNTVTFDSVDTLHKTKKQTYAFLLKETETGTFALSSIPNQN